MNLTIQNKYIPIVLCAGFGTRLKPLTNYIPKVVCPLGDKPIAFYNIEIFFKAGFQTVHCNVHYLSDIVKEELIKCCENFGYNSNRIRFWDEDIILETGGGIARIYHNLCSEELENKNKDLIVVSGDIVADFPMYDMISKWERRTENELALLCTKSLNIFRKDAIYVNKKLSHIVGFGENFDQKEHCAAKLFTNHQIISGKIVKECNIEKKSSVDMFYRKILNNHNLILNYDYSDDKYWFNIGTNQEYLQSIEYLYNDKINVHNICYTLPSKLNEKINEYVKNKGIFVENIENGKIIISFKSLIEKLNIYLPLNGVLNNSCDENIIYFNI